MPTPLPPPFSIDWRSVFVVIDTAVGFVGIALNLLLLYLILTQSPAKIKVYRLLLMNTAINDMISSLMMILLVPRVIATDWILIFGSRGVCKSFKREFCFVGISILFATCSHFLFTLPISFAYRYYVIKNNPPSSSTLLIIIFIVSIPSLLIIAFTIAKIPSAEPEFQLIEAISQFYSEFDLKDEVIYGFLDIRDWRFSYTIWLMGGSAIPLYLIVFFIRRRILIYLRGQTVSQKGIKTQREILKVLSWQAALPFLFLITVALYIWNQVTTWTNPGLECTIFLSVSFIPILSSIISILFVKPYRFWIIWHFGNLFSSTHVTPIIQRSSE